MPLAPGARLGPYEIVGTLGEGGMGEVYRATDTNLKRSVALKVLPESVAAFPDRLARFQREAEVLAALNHSNIGAIYGLERSGATTALVLELVEGPTLAERIARGPLPIDEALAIARQIAEALDAAHEHGVVHRDLKPSNVKVRHDGTVKVLDFGLAKALQTDVGSGFSRMDTDSSPTITSPAQMTGVGTILGTAAYMAPEQARGRSVDRRADIWAFGVVLYEMTTGRRLFDGDDVTDIIASVVKTEPDLSLAPPELQPLLRKCLQKDPARRLRAIGDWALLVDEAPRIAAAHVTSPAVRSRMRTALSALSVLALAALAAAFWWRAPTTNLPETRARVVLPAGIEFVPQVAAAVSSDGGKIVFAATRGNRVAGPAQLFVWSRNSLDAHPLAGTEGARAPFWSPDGRSVAFRAGLSLKRIDIDGGVAQTIADGGVAVDGGAWSRDGVILFGNAEGGISRVPASGGAPVVVTVGIKSQELHQEAPVFLPDGRHFLYAKHTIVPESTGIYLASIDAAPGDQPSTPLLLADDGPRFVVSADGHIGYVLFQRRGALLAQAIDTSTRALTGEPIPIAVGAAGGAIENLFSASAVGDVIVYRPSGNADVRRTLAWVDRSGEREVLSIEPGEYEDPLVSPDGTRVALTMNNAQGRHIWIWHLMRETLTRLTFDGGAIAPLWTRDGTRIVFNRAPGGMFSKLADGTGPEEIVGTPGGAVFGWGADGRMVWATPGLGDIGVIEPDGERRPLLAGNFSESSPAMSPDGRWMAYESDESGRFEIYVRPYPNVDGGKWQISSGGGIQPRWSPTGGDVFFVGPDRMMAVKVDTRSGFMFERPTPLFSTQGYAMIRRPRSYDVSPDGKRLLMLVEVGGNEGDEERADLVMIQNWRP